MRFVNLYKKGMSSKDAKLEGIESKYVWDLKDVLPIVIRDFLIKYKEENKMSVPLKYYKKETWEKYVQQTIDSFDKLAGRLRGEDVVQQDVDEACDNLKEIFLDLWD